MASFIKIINKIRDSLELEWINIRKGRFSKQIIMIKLFVIFVLNIINITNESFVIQLNSRIKYFLKILCENIR